MKDMTVETLNFIILCMGLLFVMAGIFLIVGKLAGKRPASIAVGVLMIAWGLLCGIPESRSWMLARATDLEHLLEAMLVSGPVSLSRRLFSDACEKA